MKSDVRLPRDQRPTPGISPSELYMSVSSSITPDWPQLETTQMPAAEEWIHGSTFICYHAAIRDEQLSHPAPQVDPKWILLCERSQTQKAMYYMLLFMILEKAKRVERTGPWLLVAGNGEGAGRGELLVVVLVVGP